ncbi:MAG: M48 metallopeptidase family protein [Acidimicrobiales bacterium]
MDDARPARPPVEVRTSARRRKTASAYWQNGKVVVVLPSWMPNADRGEMVEGLVRRVLAQQPNVRSSDAELGGRAAYLTGRYLNGTLPRSIRWVSNQRRRWGSCSAHNGDIRVSDRLRVVPGWVLDAVLVHELAHLDEPSHSARFHRLADRYPRMKEADTFLEGFSLGLEQTSPADAFASP